MRKKFLSIYIPDKKGYFSDIDYNIEVEVVEQPEHSKLLPYVENPTEEIRIKSILYFLEDKSIDYEFKIIEINVQDF